MIQQAVPPQSENMDIASQVIVTIAVKNGKLRHYPRRDNDVVAYFKEHGKDSPEKPDQVRWVARDIPAGHHVIIRAKKLNTGIFAFDEYKIPAGSNSVATGAPLKQPPRGEELNWPYSVHLMDGTREIDSLDPMVIIKNDP